MSIEQWLGLRVNYVGFVLFWNVMESHRDGNGRNRSSEFVKLRSPIRVEGTFLWSSSLKVNC